MIKQNTMQPPHLQAIMLQDENTLNIYKRLGKVLVSIAESKNPGKDYNGIKDMFV